MTELKPCPFCGRDTILSCYDAFNLEWVVKCQCGACFRSCGSTRSQTEEAWNRRVRE